MKKRKKGSDGPSIPVRVKQFRLLAIILGMALTLGYYESSRNDLPKSLEVVDERWLMEERVNLAKTLVDLYPERSHGHFLRAYQAGMCWEQQFQPAVCRSFPNKDLRDVRQALEQAIKEGGDVEQEGLFHFYAFILAQTNESPESIDKAVMVWRKHYPYSHKPDPRSPQPTQR